MELDWLQTFVVAADTMNFRKAAEALHLAQPTVTLHVQKLEQHVGLPLFERTGRSVVLSPAGRHYLSHARQVLEVYQAGRDDMLRWRQGYAESVDIAVSPLVATTLLPRFIQRYAMDHPGTEFSVLVRESSQILPAVLSGECSFGLTRLEVAHPQVKCRPLYADPIVLIAPSDVMDLDGATFGTPTDIFAQYTVLTHNHPDYWDNLTLALRKSYPQLRTMRISQVHVSIHWIVERMGVSFLPASTVQRELLRGSVVEVPFTDFELPIAHTYLLESAGGLTDAAARFVAFVQQYLRERSF